MESTVLAAYLKWSPRCAPSHLLYCWSHRPSTMPRRQVVDMRSISESSSFSLSVGGDFFFSPGLCCSSVTGLKLTGNCWMSPEESDISYFVSGKQMSSPDYFYNEAMNPPMMPISKHSTP